MDQVASWLTAIKLPQYVDAFSSNGYDDPSVIPALDDNDLQHLGVTLPGHRKRILLHAARYSTEEVAELSKINAEQQQQQQSKPAPRPRPRQRPSASSEGRNSTDALPKVPSSSSKPITKANSRPASTNLAPEDVAIQHEGTSVIRPLAITSTLTASDVIDMFVKLATPMKSDPENVWSLFETFENPPLERRLQDDEIVLQAKHRWPKTEGCRFLLRELPPRSFGQVDINKTGKLDKRGGRHKNWKSRYFELKETTLNYYTKPPSNSKQQENPAGAYVFVNHVVYNVKYYKKAPKPTLCFCLRPLLPGESFWPDVDTKELLEEFENGCKFICASSEEERTDWVASIIQRQQDLIQQGAIYGTSDLPMPESTQIVVSIIRTEKFHPIPTCPNCPQHHLQNRQHRPTQTETEKCNRSTYILYSLLGLDVLVVGLDSSNSARIILSPTLRMKQLPTQHWRPSHANKDGSVSLQSFYRTGLIASLLPCFVFLVAFIPAGGFALQTPPEWALHGQFAKSLLQASSDEYKSTALYLDFPLDHDNPVSPTFKGRYYIKNDYFKNGSVCFFSMGGEGPNNGIGKNYVTYLAEKFDALVVSIEHRFYGDSVPMDDFSVQNLQYLHSRQALADAAYLINHINTTSNYSCRAWFAFGGSYSGALSAWFRLKYPNLIVGALSSSGVVNAILNFFEFDKQVSIAIGTSCSEDLRAVTKAFKNALSSGSTSNAEAKALFGVRADIPDGDFAYMLADSAAMADQYNQKDVLCRDISGLQKQANEKIVMETFANFTKSFWSEDFGQQCFYDSLCVRSDPSRWQPTARAWWWQKCYELAYFQNAPETRSLRMNIITLMYHVERCKFMFGNGIFPAVDKTNAYYGGATPNGTNIFFSDFSDDPWSKASVQKELSPDLPYEMVTCEGCGHCYDLHYPEDSDPTALKSARKRFYLQTPPNIKVNNNALSVQQWEVDLSKHIMMILLFEGLPM
eukprot:gene5555-7215_t